MNEEILTDRYIPLKEYMRATREIEDTPLNVTPREMNERFERGDYWWRQMSESQRKLAYWHNVEWE